MSDADLSRSCPADVPVSRGAPPSCASALARGELSLPSGTRFPELRSEETLNPRENAEAHEAPAAGGHVGPPGPPPDRLIEGQPFWKVDVEPYVRRDGSTVDLLTWGAFCAECGSAYGFKLSAEAATFKPPRRCEAHRGPGRIVRRRRRSS